ncbi:MAG: c-type cytochrome [Verrucomicrobiota bacterium]
MKTNPRLHHTPLLPALALATAGLLAAAPGLAAAEANEVWTKHCASCHGKDGGGDTRMGKKLNVRSYRDPKVNAAITDDAALKAIRSGVAENGREVMKGFAYKISDEEAKALVTLLRTFKAAP